MTYPEGHPGHCSLCLKRALAEAEATFEALTPAPRAAERREQAIDLLHPNSLDTKLNS